jgi:hypothetical protein
MINKKFVSTLMMSIFILSLSFGISIPIVIAGTSIVASTDSKLSISGVGTKVLRLLPEYKVTTPDLTFEAGAKATTVVNNSGPAVIAQKYVAWGERNGATVSAGGIVSNTFSATNVMAVTSNLSSEVSVKRGKNVVHTSVSGISLANIGPEQSDYEFGLSGSHMVRTNAVAPGVGSSANGEFERIRISFEAYPTETDIPADITQSTNLLYNIENGVLSGYGFDYFNEAVANDITCSSSMNYRKGGGD